MEVRVSKLENRKRLFVNLDRVPRPTMHYGSAIKFIVGLQKALNHKYKDVTICRSSKDILTLVSNKVVYEFEDVEIRRLEELRDSLTSAIDILKEKK